GDDINIETVKLRDRTERRWKSKKTSHELIIDTTTNVGSDIEVGGNLILNSSNDTNIIGSDITATGNADITTGGDLNIASAEDTYYKYTKRSKKNSFGRRSSSTSTTNSTTNISSNINVGGDITSNSNDNINIIASNLTSDSGDIALNATNNINITAAQDTNYTKTTSSKKGVTIIKSSVDITYDVTNVHSDLKAAGSISLKSGVDTKLIGANLDSDADINIDAGKEVVVQAVADESYRYSESKKARNLATVMKYAPGITNTIKALEAATDALSFATQPLTDIGFNAAAPIMSGISGNIKNLTENDINSKTITKTEQSKNYQLAKLDAQNNINITSNDNTNLVGVDMKADNINITSNNADVNILNIKDQKYTKSTIEKSKTTFGSITTDVVKNAMLAASTIATSMNVAQHPDAKKQKVEDNQRAMEQNSQKQFKQIDSKTDETIIASKINSNNLTINSGDDVMITSSNIDTSGNIDINSDGNIAINSDYENDSSFTLTEKKNPNIIAALSNGIVNLVGDAMPDFSFKKPDEKEQNQQNARENDSLDHNPHSQDIDVATNIDNAFANGYTISNNDANELHYDTNLNKRTTKTKTYISSNITSGNNIDIDTLNGDNTIIAANIAANNDININSQNGETLIISASNESFTATSEVTQDYNDISADYNRGRVSLDSQTSIYEKDSKNTTATQLATNITSGSNININTKDDITILSSNLNSNNEINLNSTQGNTNIAANKNRQNTQTEIREGSLILSAGIGHVAVDAAYAVDDTVKAAENVKKAKEGLSRMKRLQKEDKATKQAVDDAKTNLAIAVLNYELSLLKIAAAAEKARGSAHTFGFYADAQLIRSGDKTNIISDSSQEIASNLIAINDININSGSSLTSSNTSSEIGNSNIKGNIQSINQDINITSFNNTNVEAIKNDSSSLTKTEGFTQSISLGASYGKSATQELI
ncbi:hemagglutinin repeat-containing protein, partial [Rickettsiales bacterium]|nr:hemagglutinin repeat-containing protein [Rickettsiales bacterium]